MDSREAGGDLQADLLFLAVIHAIQRTLHWLGAVALFVQGTDEDCIGVLPAGANVSICCIKAVGKDGQLEPIGTGKVAALGLVIAGAGLGAGEARPAVAAAGAGGCNGPSLAVVVVAVQQPAAEGVQVVQVVQGR